MVIKLLN